MCANPDDLWPLDLGPSGQKAPIAILREQGSLLGKKTKNLVLGRVKAERDIIFIPIPPSRGGPKDLSFFYSFFLVAPALDNYAIKLFTVGHGIEFYPAVFNVLEEGEPGMARSEAEFMEILRGVFASEHTKRVIESLLSQSQVAV